MALTASKKDIASVWKEFKLTRNPELRNRLMEHYFPLVKFTADRISAKLPNEVEVDDLISAGVFGLVDAIEAFDLDRGVKFETYCSPRIRGAILDELRTMDWVPRLVRSRAHKLETATKVLQAELGRQPTQQEIARRLRLSTAEMEKITRDANTVTQISLSRRYQDNDSNHEMQEIDILEDRRSIDPTEELQQHDLHTMVMSWMTRIERLIIVLYYYEEMTMKEIGATLDLSESRVSQMHSSILSRMRHHLHRAGHLPKTEPQPAET